METELIIFLSILATVFYSWFGFGCYKMHRKKEIHEDLPDLLILAFWPFGL